MARFVWSMIGLVVIGSVLGGAAAAQATGHRSTKSEIARALSAAPPQVAAGAAVISMDDNGKTTELRAGNNGWTCLPHDPGTPMGHPLCLDKNGLDWMVAAMTNRPPDADKVGYSYMLQGGTSWSNKDFSATKLDPGLKDFIRIPPHFMILNAKIADASGYPSGEMNPNTHKPWVMYGGTPYAVLMIPLQ